MRNEKDKDLEQLIANELMNDLGIDEEKMLSRLRFKEKTPWYKNYKIFIPVVSFCMLCLLVLTSVLSITIYSNVNDGYIEKDDIVYVALEAFEDEIDGFRDYVKLSLYQIDNEIIVSYYIYEGKSKMIIFTNEIDGIIYDIFLNERKFSIKTNVSVFDVSLIQNNELIIYKNNIEIYNLNFTN